MATKLAATTRAQLAAWRGAAHEARWRLRAAVARRSSALVVFAGALGALGGGWLIGRWALGLVLIGESVFAAYVGLNRDDEQWVPPRGARTVEQVLADEQWRPE